MNLAPALASVALAAALVVAGGPNGAWASAEVGPAETESAETEISVSGVRDPLAFDVAGLNLQTIALVAINFDPWMLEDGHIPTIRQDVVSNRAHHRERTAEAEVELVAAQAVFDDADARLIEAQRVRDEVERDVEGYAVRIWVLGDEGLQEALGSEVAILRQTEPLEAATNGLVERVHDADQELAASSEAFSVAVDQLAIRTEVHDRAALLLNQAEQIVDRFNATVVARNEAISKWTHEVLEAEAEPVDLVRVDSILVPAGGGTSDEDAPVAEEDEGAGEGDNGDESAVEDDGADDPVETPPDLVVAIDPITVNAEIAGSLAALLGSARADGIQLGGWGFREREMQIILRREHCGTSGYALFERPAGECNPPTARPGHSEHELGLAIDFIENGAVLNATSPGFVWLVEHGAEYGLINLPSEPWHWSTTGH